MQSIKVPQKLFREATITQTGEGEARSFSMSISSEKAEVLRYDWANDREYFEVLDHGPEGISKERLDAGLPILFNHDRDKHLARAKSYSVAGGKCELRDFIWSESEFAKEKKRDAENGSLPDTSVGYRILGQGEQIGTREGKPVIKFRWQPFEGSLVTIPADLGTGVGRHQRDLDAAGKQLVDVAVVDNSQRANPEEKSMADNPTPEQNREAEQPRIDVKEVQSKAVETERKRVADIQELNKHFREKGLAGRKIDTNELAEKFIRDGKGLREFQDEVVRGEFKEITSVETPQDRGQRMSDVPAKDKQRFSLMKAIRRLANKQPLEGIERELSDEAAKRSGISPRVDAIYVGPEINGDDLRNHPEFNERAYESFLRSVNVTSGTAGGFTVATQMGSMIELLRNKTVLNRAGVTTISGLHGDLAFPVQTGGATAYWVGEEECVTDSAPTFAQKALTPHRLSASIPFTSQFLAQSSVNAEQFLRNELMTVAGLAIDKAGLEGSGSGGEPLGVKNVSGVGGDITFSGAAEFADIVNFETQIAADNADIGSVAFIVSTATRGKWKVIPKVATYGTVYLIEGNLANGYPVYATNQLSDNVVYFGVWSQLLHAMWDTQEIIVDPYALKKCGGIEITYNSFHDFLVRQPAAFQVSTDSGAA